MDCLSDRKVRCLSDLTNNQNTILKALVEEFNSQANLSLKESILEKIFTHFYVHFDKTIRSTLIYNGIPYEPSNSYYELVFTEIYHRIFSLASFEYKLKNFDFGRPFIPWLTQITRNTIRDWLKKVNDDCGMNNREILKRKMALDSSDESDISVVANNFVDYSWPPSNILEGGKDNCSTNVEGGRSNFDDCFIEGIEALSMDQQVVIYAGLLAYFKMPNQIINYIAEQTNRSGDEVRAGFDDLHKQLRLSNKYLKNKNKIKKLYMMHCRAGVYEKKLHYLRQELEGFGLINIAGLETRAPNMPTKENIKLLVDEKNRKINRAFQQKDGEPNTAYIEYIKNRYIQVFADYHGNQKNREQILADLKMGKLIVAPRSKQIEALIRVPYNVIDARRKRAKSAFLKVYQECINRGNRK